jgi:hypothetical protein
VRQRRGEEQPDAWYEVSVAAVPLSRPAPSAGLQPLPVQGDYTGVHNGRTAFVWMKGRLGAGASLAAEELPQLLQAAQAATGSR